MSWLVMLTEPNRESSATRHLKFLNAEYYLPIYTRAHCQRVSGGRRWRIYRRPLFPGYLFVNGPLDQLWAWSRIVSGIRRCQCPFLAPGGQVATVGAAKIAELRVLEATINAKRSQRLSFRVGDRVLVSDGAFTGLRATVHMLSDRARVQLLLDFLGRQTRVELGADQLQAVA